MILARLFSIFASALIAMFLACSSPAPIKIGFSGQLTGQFSDLGVQGRNGAMLAVEEINASGGINGRPLQLIAEDDLGTPEGAKTADEALLSQGVIAIIGHMTSSQTISVIPLINARNGILISPTSATPALEGKRDGFFRVIPSNTHWATDLASYALRENCKRALLLGDIDNTSYTETFLETFEKQYSAHGGVIAGLVQISSKAKIDWPGVAKNILEHKPQVVIACVSARDLASLTHVLRPTENGIRVMGPTWPSTNDLILLGGKDVEGFEFATNYAEDNPRPEFVQFRKRFQARFGWPAGFAAAYAFESVHLLAQALKMTGGRSQGLEQALGSGQRLEGVIGHFSLNEFGDVRRPSFIIQVKNGVYVTKTRIEDLP